MTVSFMVLGGPRSGTTWMANLLTTDTTLCLHDPLLEFKHSVLDQMTVPGKKLGISCTSALLFPEWIRNHSAKKILLWREPHEINVSLRQLGLAEITPAKHCMRVHSFGDIPIFPWNKIFDFRIAKEICGILDVPFDSYRFNELVKMNVQPQWNRLPATREAVMEHVEQVRKMVV